jgi:ribosomal protein S18 acetylase RimI-like enzyme
VRATIREVFKLPYIEHIILGVKAANTSAIRVYQRAGFYSYNSGGNQAALDDDGLQKMIIHRDR